MLLLQEFEFDILHRLGVQHAMFDYLICLESGEGTGVKDDFPNSKFFQVDTVSVTEMNDNTMDAWITKMTIFLSTRLSPENMSLDERKLLVARS